MLLVPEWYIGTERTPPLLQVTVKISKLWSPFLWGRRVQSLCTGLQTFQQSLLRGNFWLHILVHHTKKMGYLSLKTQSPTFSHNRILKKEPRVLKKSLKCPLTSPAASEAGFVASHCLWSGMENLNCTEIRTCSTRTAKMRDLSHI